jgi:hypothetical protein
MTFGWFFIAFPWIGGAAAGVLVVVLFATNLLRSEHTSTRWRDPLWLSWMALVVYLLHNVEEYGLDLRGQTNAFPNALCANLGLPPFPNCPVPPAFFLAVNISLFWVVGPLVALLTPRHPLVGFALYTVIPINALVHIVGVLATGQPYNPGLLTSLVLFVPLSVWVGYACFGNNRLSYKAMVLLLVWGVMLHVILVGSLKMYISGLISRTAVVWAQIMNAGLLVLVLWLAERWRCGALIRPVRG